MSEIGDQEIDLVVPIGGLVIDSDLLKWAVLKIPTNRCFRVDSATLSAPVAVAATDTNYNVLSLRNNSQTAAPIMDFPNGPAAAPGQAVTLDASTAFVNNAAFETNRYVGSRTAETTLFLTSTKTGNGLALPNLTLHLRGMWIQ